MRLPPISCFLTFALALLGAAPALRADTIVLKNGRRIVAEAVREDGERIRYESEIGPVSIAKALVDHVEKDDALPPRRLARPDSTPSEFEQHLAEDLGSSMQPPAADQEGVVRGDAVDEERLQALAALASKGDLERQNAVNGYLIAAVFEARKQRLASASRWVEAALALSSQDRNALLIAAQIDIERRQYSQAVRRLQLADSLWPDSPDVLIMLGNAYYFAAGPEQALRYWTRANARRSDPLLAQRIAQAEQEAKVEGALKQAESYHFNLSWEGAAAPPTFGRDVLATLEQQYSGLESALGYSPREPVTVILYTNEQFQDITRAPGWAGAINDGKIRVPVQGLPGVTGRLAQVLQHEMTHSFVHQMVQGRCPTWLNEGLAQYFSGEERRWPGGSSANALWIPLRQLEGSFLAFDPYQATIAYAESLAAVQLIAEQYGDYRLPQLLEALRQGQNMAQALESVLHIGYEQLEAGLKARLGVE